MNQKPHIVGKNATPVGIFPAVCLMNPKYSANVGAALRACSCFDVKQLWWTGDRVQMPGKGERLPREERMKGYRDVDMIQFDRPFDHFEGATPVAIELLDNTECIFDFEHPKNAVYVFGPEDGNIGLARRHCHRFVSIPTRHCTNLAAAVYLVLYDRMYKHYLKTGEKLVLNEDRGFVDANANEDVWKELQEKHKNGVAFL